LTKITDNDYATSARAPSAAARPIAPAWLAGVAAAFFVTWLTDDEALVV